MTDRSFFDSGFTGVINLEIADEQIMWYALDGVSSTMDYTIGIVESASGFWTLVTAANQFCGRGTHGRDWVSPNGKGLYMSLAVPPPCDSGRIEELSLETAAILVETLRCILDLTGTIKCPNDVLVNGRKIAGILYESKTRDNAFSYLVLGLGLNLSQTIEDFRKEELPDATSLLIETGHNPGITAVLLPFLERFIPMYKELSGMAVVE